MLLTELSALPEPRAAEVVAVWAAVPTWVEAIVAARPYGSREALESHAASLAARWTRADLDAALAHHPRIGERPRGTGEEAAASRSEQASMADAEADVTTAIAHANAAYEARFGRVFLIRAAGRSPEEMLAEARRRLHNDDEAEVREALDQLAQIALLRLRTTIEDATEEDA
ncbi:OHCU decarboxylase [Serinibacter arcticus]|uniref:2-oxo-4-hydroxy-4-carboxy-5-ureidoimidazoline decarboxylase n=1 Tax=Serinibacter arcticus TaxID=1655435 RepID=A0A2U1ZXK5_9MICO|nr:2-oxo-4-hydroxy-4-carboxy-5-ureidoimidazoline decarboxylase [Serinibacter arcticus]PWD51701.1 OHCU decarboxylase [Serinibacter arcticus]